VCCNDNFMLVMLSILTWIVSRLLLGMSLRVSWLPKKFDLSLGMWLYELSIVIN